MAVEGHLRKVMLLVVLVVSSQYLIFRLASFNLLAS